MSVERAYILDFILKNSVYRGILGTRLFQSSEFWSAFAQWWLKVSVQKLKAEVISL
ncbi:MULTISPECIES: hypothetical protein [unclassified Microcoleus]|uniref:hypothetical protein n=1 Tax=unclassified Microcoleus TaxID=2642155 RepID=UPI002FD5414D